MEEQIKEIEKKAKKKSKCKHNLDKECTCDKCECSKLNDIADKDYKSLYIQALADYQNLRKRNAKDIQTTYRNATENLLVSFIQIYDAAKRGTQYDEMGATLIYNKFRDVLKSLNISVIDYKFIEDELKSNVLNDAYCEATLTSNTNVKELDNTIAEVISDGFYDNTSKQTLVYAKVVVYKYV